MSYRTVRLTEGERNALLNAATYFRDDADPSREGDLRSIHPQTWDALDRAIAKLRGLGR